MTTLPSSEADDITLLRRAQARHRRLSAPRLNSSFPLIDIVTPQPKTAPSFFANLKKQSAAKNKRAARITRRRKVM